ncbi:MAG: hypothetical protein A2W91_11215 [Bacteroidetes bacterium GWF2_38_335]|nr:MAG: hypothetical protein A2W91_11215 [Bacteroidetes bacterium GWF2_38_335]OFY81734.1 MAG: hypothetical protein A2281_05825 [Bacteroidetes bacterium RIFOXYA12_FULL_38_20]HBS87798.1 hypothetical protein [Bacteroidales bacterium]
MKIILLFFLALCSALMGLAQDTIFMKNGSAIPCEIVKANSAEINYKKQGVENKAIYSALVVDVSKVKYQNGKIVDYTAEINTLNISEEKELNPANSMRFSFGMYINYFNRNETDDLLGFWRFWNNNNQLGLDLKHRYFSFSLGMVSPIGNKRTWIGTHLHLYSTAKGTINAQNYYYGANEVNLRAFLMNVIIDYGRSISRKKNVILFFEPTLEIAMVSGNINMFGTEYTEFTMSGGPGFHTGVDWIISKRITFVMRAGYRFVKLDESHRKGDSYDYNSFLAHPGVNDEVVRINWGGFIFRTGLTFSLFSKIQ